MCVCASCVCEGILSLLWLRRWRRCTGTKPISTQEPAEEALVLLVRWWWLDQKFKMEQCDFFFFKKKSPKNIFCKVGPDHLFSVVAAQCSKIRKKVQFQKYKNTLFAFSKMAKNQFLHQKKVRKLHFW